MSERQRRLECYRRQRAYLIALLGGKCVDCGQDDPTKLEFGHTEPRLWTACKTSRLVRVANYGREAFEVTEDGRLVKTGVIVLQCGVCNKRFGRPQPVTTLPDSPERMRA